VSHLNEKEEIMVIKVTVRVYIISQALGKDGLFPESGNFYSLASLFGDL
jgi:hypothetical protein